MATREDIETWLARAGLGDRAAFEAIYSATSAKLFGICLRVLQDRAEAEDALQEIYVKIWNNASRYQANGLSPMTWLITVARNHAIDRLRARKSHPSGSDDGLDAVADLPSHAPGPAEAAEAASDAAQLGACLDELKTERAEAVRRVYMFGDSYAELATRFDVPLNTMRTWLRRSLAQLKECLGS